VTSSASWTSRSPPDHDFVSLLQRRCLDEGSPITQNPQQPQDKQEASDGAESDASYGARAGTPKLIAARNVARLALGAVVVAFEQSLWYSSQEGVRGCAELPGVEDAGV
jgi:hypothetical protein